MVLRAAFVFVGLLTTSGMHAAEPGEFYIPEVVPLTSPQIERLRELISTDKEAADRAEEVRQDASGLLNSEPTPVEEIHYEGLVNTKVQLDRDRAAAGIEKYRAGEPYDPQDTLKVMELASHFNPDLMDVVLHLTKSESRRFPTWTTLVSAACAQRIDGTAQFGQFESSPLFVSGESGYHTYRIPSLLVTKSGTLLAFCEGRKSSWKDHGDVDLLLRRSTDGGQTWSEQQIVYEEGGSERITIGNPCPVVDQATGYIWLPLCRDNRDVLITFSKDDGQTWSAPRDISSQVVRNDWTWVATGPGVGIQLQQGKRAGRLVIPCDHRDGQPVKDDSRNRCFSHVIYSDDHGQTWHLGGSTQAGSYECQVIELADGRLMLNGRMQQQSQGYRGVSYSNDGGNTWSEIRHDNQLPDPICQASLIRLPTAGESLLLFSNPAVKFRRGADKNKQRHCLAIKLSRDGGQTWPVERVLHEGPAAYSCLANLPDGTIACLFESGDKHYRESITLALFDQGWLEGSVHSDTADSRALSTAAPTENDFVAKRQTMPDPIESFLRENCLDCHDASTQEGQLDLSRLSFDLTDRTVFDRWVQICDRVQNGEMPPEKVLDAADARPFLDTLAKPLADADRDRVAKSGRATVRRLNRFEYENSLRELLRAPWLRVADELPEDSTSHFFNKSGESLDVSHVQLTKYMEVGRSALRMALGAAAHPPQIQRYYAREEPVILHYMRWRPGLQTAATRATIPLLGTEPQPNAIRGTQPLTVGDAEPETREREAMGVVSGTFEATTKYDFTRMELPIDGNYIVRMKTYTFMAGPNGASGGNDHGLTGGKKAWWRPSRTVAFPGRRSEPVTLYALADSGSTRWLTTFDSYPEPGIFEQTLALKKGEMIRPDASRLVRTRPGWSGNPNATADGVPGFAMNWLEIEGPVTSGWPPESYRALFGEMPFEIRDGNVLVLSRTPDQDALRLVTDFARRAARGRVVSEESLELFMAVFREARRLDNDFTDATLAAFNAVLCSPDFLYLKEHPGELDPPALATRLAMFLWNGPPDEQLLSAFQESPHDETLERVLATQTERLLDDPKRGWFTTAFLDYWLELRQLNDTVPDAELYPEYFLDSMLAESAALETRMFFDALIDANLPARNLIDSDFTFVNERLASHYGLETDQQSIELRRIRLPEDSPRGGLLTQASVMKVTANGTTTSPVLRGVWIVERLLGTEIPEPPSGVEAIEPDTRGATTIREQLTKHVAVESCATCHQKFDPIGFALESFDVMGGWQDKYRALGDIGEHVQGYGKNGHAFVYRLAQPVESHATLARGDKFANIFELKSLLLKDERLIARNLVNHLVAYATGAPVSFADRMEVEQILDDAKPGDYGVRDLIHGVVQSSMFRNK